MGTEVVHGSLGASVTGYELAHIDVQAGPLVRTTQEPVLLIHLTLQNYGETSLRYDPGDASTHAQQARTPVLFVDPGPGNPTSAELNVANVNLGANRYAPDQVTEPVVIAPSQTVNDTLLFQQPPAGTSSLRLSLPPSMFGPDIELPLWITIPYAPGEPVQPHIGTLGEVIDGDGFSLTVDRSEVTYLPNADRTGFTDMPKLAVWYTIRNTGDEPVQYVPPQASAGQAGPFPALIDRTTYMTGAERAFHVATLPQGGSLAGQVAIRTVIPPGGTLTDVVPFARPEQGVTELLLYFPGAMVGRLGQLRVGFAYSFADPPLPEELRTPVPTPTPTPEPTEEGE